MFKNLFLFIKKNREKIFPWIVSAYMYILYFRIIYLVYKELMERINRDIYQYNLNRMEWLFNSVGSMGDILVILMLTAVILTSFYLIYKHSPYFYAVMIFPIFLLLSIFALFSFYNILFAG